MTPKKHPGFSSGRTVKARDLQYIQRPADAELLDHCQNGRPAYILHSPQMGKSSLIAHTAEQLNANSHHAVIIDLSQFSLPPREEEWFHNIVRILDDSLDLSTDALGWWEDHQAQLPHKRLTNLLTDVILPEITAPLVLFIDEIERTVTLPFREHFFEWLTTLYESRATNSILYRLSFVVCGVATPSQLIPEGWPLLFQWSHRVVLSDFTLQEALPLAEGLSFPTEVANEMVTWVYRWTKGHPYLTQLLCQLLEEKHQIAWLETEVDECIQHFIVSSQVLREPNFQFVRTALTEPDAHGMSLLRAYLDLLEGNTENLRTNPSALEQLRLVGVLHEDDEVIAIRNTLYQEAFSIAWVKRHLSSPLETQLVPVATPQSVPPPLPASQPSYIMAASLFLLGLGLLVWFIRAPVSTDLSVTSQNIPSASIEPPPAPSDLTEMAKIPQQPESLTQAQEKIQELEATIVPYQQLSTGEVQSLIDQRTQLETELASKDRALSDLQVQVQTLTSELHDQQNAHEQSMADLQAERAQLQAKTTTTAGELKTALEEVKTLQVAVLKNSSFSPSEINKLMADRSQLDTQLKTANTELALAHERARGLGARLTQQQGLQTENQRLVEGQARLEEQIQSAESALHETRLALKTTETSAQEQAKLARTELARLQKERSDYQEQLHSRQQAITALETRAEKSGTTLSEKEQEIRETRQEIATLEIRADALGNTVSERDQNLQHAQQTINGLTSELQEVRARESQTNGRISKLDLMLAEQRQTTDRTLLTRQQERDQFKTQLTLAQQKLNTTKTQMASLADQLAEVQQTAANSQNTIKTIHASSSEKSRHAENQIAALTHTSTELETRLRESEEAFHQAQQRITELETNSTNVSEMGNHVRQTTEERDQFGTQLKDTQQQLAKAQEHIQSLEQALTAVSSADKRSGADRLFSSTVANPFPFYKEEGSWKIDLTEITKIGETGLTHSQEKSGKTEEDFIFDFVP